LPDHIGIGFDFQPRGNGPQFGYVFLAVAADRIPERPVFRRRYAVDLSANERLHPARGDPQRDGCLVHGVIQLGTEPTPPLNGGTDTARDILGQSIRCATAYFCTGFSLRHLSLSFPKEGEGADRDGEFDDRGGNPGSRHHGRIGRPVLSRWHEKAAGPRQGTGAV
jgi:hypothetical protein